MFDGHQQEIYALEFSSDGRLLISGSGDKTARVWDVGTLLGMNGAAEGGEAAKPVVLTIEDAASEVMKDLDVDGDATGSVASSETGDDDDYDDDDDEDGESNKRGRTRTRNGKRGSKAKGGKGTDAQGDVEMGDAPEAQGTTNSTSSDPTDSGITSLAVSPDGRYIAAGSLDSVIRLWDLKPVSNGSATPMGPVLIERLKGHKDSVYSVSFTRDGKFLVTASLDRGVRVWDVGHLEIVPADREDSSSPTRNGRAKAKSAAGGEERRVLRSVTRKQQMKSRCVTQFVGHRDFVLSVAVSYDGKWVVSGSKDRAVMWWDLGSSYQDLEEGDKSKKEREAVCVLQGHKNSVISIDLSPVGNLLATGSGDWQARICEYSIFLLFIWTRCLMVTSGSYKSIGAP